MNSSPAGGSGTSDARLGGGARFGPVAALVVAALLRFYQLGMRPIWTDEGCSWTASRLPITELLHRCVHRDASPPLYYLLTSLALRFGEDEWHLRIVSVLASLVLVWLTYRLARLGMARGPSTFAAFLTALSPFQIQYAQESRTYALVGALLVGSTYVYARLQQRPGPQRWLPLVLLTAAGLWTQSIAALGMGAQAVIAVLTPTGRKRFRPWAGAMAVAAILYLPWLVYSRDMAHRLGDSHWYVPVADQHAVFKVVRALLVSPFPLVGAPANSTDPGLGRWLPAPLAYALLSIPPLLALLVTLPRVLERSAHGFVSRLCWSGWLVPLVAVTLVSLRHPLLLQRYFVFATPFVAVLFALGISSLRPAAGRVLLGASLVALSLMGLKRYTHDFTKEPWREVTAHIRSIAPPGHTVILVPFESDPLRFYLRDGRSDLVPVEVVHPDVPFSAHFTPRQLDEVDEATRRESQPFAEVWVIIRSANNHDRWELARRTLQIAAEGRVLAERRIWQSYDAPLYVSRFARPDTAAAPKR
jgi:4-amino-4-deoxy-L-arabinose transferase-like glycosyltransferase